jgi:hypothetical protein
MERPTKGRNKVKNFMVLKLTNATEESVCVGWFLWKDIGISLLRPTTWPALDARVFSRVNQ